jgi:hypothetical protein
MAKSATKLYRMSGSDPQSQKQVESSQDKPPKKHGRGGLLLDLELRRPFLRYHAGVHRHAIRPQDFWALSGIMPVRNRKPERYENDGRLAVKTIETDRPIKTKNRGKVANANGSDRNRISLGWSKPMYPGHPQRHDKAKD